MKSYCINAKRIRGVILWIVALAGIATALVLVLQKEQNKGLDSSPHGLLKTSSLTLNAKDLEGLLSNELSAYLPFETLHAQIKSDGMITLTAQVAREDLQELLAQRTSIPSSLRLAASLLPRKIDASLVLEIAKKENSVVFTPSKLTISGLDLTSLVTNEMTGALNSGIAHYFDSQNLEIISLETKDDAIELTVKQKPV